VSRPKALDAEGQVMSRQGLKTLEEAYGIFGLELTASAGRIKRRYRALLRVWRPERHRPGSPERCLAVARTARLAAAYRQVKHAPLRRQRPRPLILPMLLRKLFSPAERSLG
jgi:hypothetical protein